MRHSPVKVLFVTNEPLTERRSGPAIRCLELARVIAQLHETTVATLAHAEIELEDVLLVEAAPKKSALLDAVRANDVVITQGMVLARVPALAGIAKHLVIDLYDPYLLEYLAHAHPLYPKWGYLRQLYRLNQQMSVGDLFLCANERQWDYWLGRLCALGRLNTEEYQRDPSFRSLLAVVPFGLSAQPPEHTKNVLKGVVRGIGKEDFVLLWAGGIWQWLDPLTVIRAVAEAAKQNPRVKLVFIGSQDPNPNNREMAMAGEARRLAETLGVVDCSVFFLQGWVPYQERQDYLLEADMGVSAHPASVESRFAFRTRVLDYLWAGLPMILSAGDDFGELVERKALGAAIVPGDVHEWRSAIVRFAEDRAALEQACANVGELAPSFVWAQVAEPLLHYCEKPYKTDKGSPLKRRLAPLLSSGYEIVKGMTRPT